MIKILMKNSLLRKWLFSNKFCSTFDGKGLDFPVRVSLHCLQKAFKDLRQKSTTVNGILIMIYYTYRIIHTYDAV